MEEGRLLYSFLPFLSVVLRVVLGEGCGGLPSSKHPAESDPGNARTFCEKPGNKWSFMSGYRRLVTLMELVKRAGGKPGEEKEAQCSKGNDGSGCG